MGDFGVLFVYLLDYASCAVGECSYHVIVDRNVIFAAAVANINLIALAMEGKYYHHLASSYLTKAFHVKLHNIEVRTFVENFSLCEHVSQLFGIRGV